MRGFIYHLSHGRGEGSVFMQMLIIAFFNNGNKCLQKIWGEEIIKANVAIVFGKEGI